MSFVTSFSLSYLALSFTPVCTQTLDSAPSVAHDCGIIYQHPTSCACILFVKHNTRTHRFQLWNLAEGKINSRLGTLGSPGRYSNNIFRGIHQLFLHPLIPVDIVLLFFLFTPWSWFNKIDNCEGGKYRYQLYVSSCDITGQFVEKIITWTIQRNITQK